MLFFLCYIYFRFAAVRIFDEFSFLKTPRCTKIKTRASVGSQKNEEKTLDNGKMLKEQLN